MSSFDELRNRDVFKAAVAYLVGAWLVLQVADVVLNNLGAPSWLFRVIFLAIVVGFPLVVLTYWVLESSPRDAKGNVSTRRKLAVSAAGLLVVATAFVGFSQLDFGRDFLSSDDDSIDVARSRDASVAVLPFSTRSNDENDLFFAAGMHDDILTQLSKLSGLTKVISRTSSERYRDTDKTIREIGRELAVRTILEGAIQRAGNRVRINLQLIDSVTDEHLWADTFDYELTIENLFAVQNEISREVALALNSTITEAESGRLGRLPTSSLEAYKHYVSGRQAMADRSPDSLATALSEFEQAVAIDPDYSLAHVGVADTLAMQWEYAGLSEDEMLPSFQAAIEKALSIDPALGEAYASLGLLHHFGAWQIWDFPGSPDEAEENLKRAIELSPNYATAYHWYAIMLRDTGRAEEAIVQIRKAIELDPATPVLTSTLAGLLNQLGRSEEAEAELLRALRHAPGFALLYRDMAEIFYGRGQIGTAAAWARQGRLVNPNHFNTANLECTLYVELQALQRAERCVDMLTTEYADELYPNAIAHLEVMALMAAGKPDKAAAVLSALDDQYATMMLAGVRSLEGQTNAARALLEPLPFLAAFYSDEPVELDFGQAELAVFIAATLCDGASCTDRSKYLATEALKIFDGMPRTQGNAVGSNDVDAYLVVGDRSNAVKAGREAFDAGYREFWWGLRSPWYQHFFEGTPEAADWQTLLNDFENDIAEQRSWFEQNKDEPLY